MTQRFTTDSDGNVYDTHKDCYVSDEKILNALNLLNDILGGESGGVLKQRATDLGWNINKFGYQERSDHFLMRVYYLEHLIYHLLEKTV